MTLLLYQYFNYSSLLKVPKKSSSFCGLQWIYCIHFLKSSMISEYIFRWGVCLITIECKIYERANLRIFYIWEKRTFFKQKTSLFTKKSHVNMTKKSHENFEKCVIFSVKKTPFFLKSAYQTSDESLYFYFLCEKGSIWVRPLGPCGPRFY